jgi:hypothetical protein
MEKRRFDGYFKKEIRTVPFVPPPMGGCDNPRMGKDILDLCNWLENMADYPLKSTMGLLSKTVDILGEGGGRGVLIASHHRRSLSRMKTSFCHTRWKTTKDNSSRAPAGQTIRLHCQPGPKSPKKNLL